MINLCDPRDYTIKFLLEWTKVKTTVSIKLTYKLYTDFCWWSAVIWLTKWTGEIDLIRSTVSNIKSIALYEFGISSPILEVFLVFIVCPFVNHALSLSGMLFSIRVTIGIAKAQKPTNSSMTNSSDSFSPFSIGSRESNLKEKKKQIKCNGPWDIMWTINIRYLGTCKI